MARLGTRDDQSPKVGLVVRDDTDSNMLRLLEELDSTIWKQNNMN